MQGKELKATEDANLKNGALNEAMVGQPAYKIAELAGFSVPENTKILIGEVTIVDENKTFAHEKLSPTLAMYRAKKSKTRSKSRETGCCGRYRSYLLPVH
ncbi:hypothetical protein ACLK1U_07145 [Escherichia coli]